LKSVLAEDDRRLVVTRIRPAFTAMILDPGQPPGQHKSPLRSGLLRLGSVVYLILAD
jgi:hypothetical protein